MVGRNIMQSNEKTLTSTEKLDLEKLAWLRDQYNAGVNSKHREHAANKIMLMMDDLIERLKENK